MERHILDDVIYPPFEGFPEDGLKFLKKLKKNNTREWFGKHKSEYEDYVKFPMQCLISTLAPQIHEFAPEIEVHPQRSMFRIYRDTRFSKDKTPYKTHVAAHFSPTGNKMDGAGLYVHVEPGEVYLGGGYYMPSSDHLRAIRRAIDKRSEEFLAFLGGHHFKKTFGELVGDKLSRVPQGFEKNHPMSNYLRMKQFYAGVSLPENEALRQDFPKKIIEVLRIVYPLVEFINSAIGKGK